jgi:hypothetical protein
MLRYNLIYKPACTEVICRSNINVIHYRNVTNHIWYPYSTTPLTWKRCESNHAELESNKFGTYSEILISKYINGLVMTRK